MWIDGEALPGHGEPASSDWSGWLRFDSLDKMNFFDLLTNFACYLICTVPGLAAGALERLVGEIIHGNENKL